jgi:hypothetical protein
MRKSLNLTNVTGQYEPICDREAIRAWSPGWGQAKIEVKLQLLGDLVTVLDTNDPAKMLDLAEQLDDVAAELRGFAQRQIALRAEEQAEIDAAEHATLRGGEGARVMSTYRAGQGYPTPVKGVA